MKPARYIVHLPGDEVAKFSDRDHALDYGRCASRIARNAGFLIQVTEALGIIGQFDAGMATPEFAHLDRRAA